MATNNNEFFDALAALEKERGLPADYLIDKIKAAIVIAVKKDYEVEDDNVVVDIDPNIGAFRASLLQDIVEEVENPHTQVSLEDAQKIRKTYKVGQRLVTPLKTKEFGRIAAQTAKHVIRQGLREGERSLQCSEMQQHRAGSRQGRQRCSAQKRAGARRTLYRRPDGPGLCGRCSGNRARPPRDHQPHPSRPGQAHV